MVVEMKRWVVLIPVKVYPEGDEDAIRSDVMVRLTVSSPSYFSRSEVAVDALCNFVEEVVEL